MDQQSCESVQYSHDAVQIMTNDIELKRTEARLPTAVELCAKVFDARDNTLESIETSCAEALKGVDSYRRKVNDALDTAQAAIVGKAEMMKRSALSKITNITDKCQELQRELQELQTKHFKRTQLTSDLYFHNMQLKDRLDVMEGELKEAEIQLTLQTTRIKFTPNSELLETLANSIVFGKLTGKESGAIMKAEHILDINVKTPTDIDNCWITGSTILSDNTLVIADEKNRSIKVVNVPRRQVIEQTSLSSPPWDVCTIKKDQVAVTLPKDNKIIIVKVEDCVTVDRTISVNGQCHGIDYKDKKFAVSFVSDPKVQVISLQGSVLYDIITDKQGQLLFSYPLYVTFDQAGTTIYVSNMINNNVVRVKLDGTLLSTYTDSELRSPTGSVTDSDGNVYVCGNNSHNVHQISADCRKRRELLREVDDIDKPWSISYRETDDTFCVGTVKSNNIAVCKSLPESSLHTENAMVRYCAIL